MNIDRRLSILEEARPPADCEVAELVRAGWAAVAASQRRAGLAEAEIVAYRARARAAAEAADDSSVTDAEVQELVADVRQLVAADVRDLVCDVEADMARRWDATGKELPCQT
jgi:hypothetical protein